MVESVGLLVKVRGDGAALKAAAGAAFGAAATRVKPILNVPAQPAADEQGLAGASSATWMQIEAQTEEHPWDAAYRLVGPEAPFAAAGNTIEALEPDLVQGWLDGAPDPQAAAANQAEFCAFDPQNEKGGQAPGPGLAWNLGDDFSEFAAARSTVGAKLERIIVAHLDTGFDPNHATLPINLARDLQRNFVDEKLPGDASDRTPPGMEFVRNRGHGTGTLSLLAGNKLDGSSPGWSGFADFIGGAPLARIIPIRIADWVVRFSTSTMVQGFDYARANGAHVLSMSMGGLSSRALIDAVNLAYEHGVVMVTAAGNNYAAVPSPKSIVFPARLKRVLAACGVMADGRAYAGLRPLTMQGNYGPAEKMDTALGAYTPNVPWAQISCAKIVDMDGRGTSAATPQVAAAAALWLAEHWDQVSRYSEPWMRVEAVRHALFTSARKSTAKMNSAETHEKIGQGVVRARAALAIAPPTEAELRNTKLPPAQPSWSWLNVLFGGGVSFALGMPVTPQLRAALALELTQMAQRVRTVDEAIDDPGRPASEIPATARNRYLEAALDEGQPSKRLRTVLQQLLGRKGAAPTTAPRAVEYRPVKRKLKAPPTPRRRLRAYALDPSVGKRLATLDINETTLSVPWDASLKPGPVGEYLEVIDVDPASNRVYDPVDLDDAQLLAQDGWSPSEGNPQFHQQMVYAVGMTTIGHFEKALGRKTLWAPRIDERGASEVKRLRIYPHALRTENAYYSPDKKALLFGYFPSSSGEGDATAAGSMVFSCLSSDIIAHEMTHALLDGLHRRYEEPSNPDVLAFHEAFADIVAVFQHFTIRELVRFEISRARGDLKKDGLLAGLAVQFGEGSGQRGPLRNYVHADPKQLRYSDVTESHTRGSILVYAVYDAFRNIVERRTDDLIRIATGGTGVIAPGAVHPDLVDRLTDETSKAASHVLRMCVRALDYCPPVDITFGDYLRAIITADLEVVANDVNGYRVAFMEAFRKWSILPRDVRTISEQTLSWNPPESQSPAWLKDLVDTRIDETALNAKDDDRILFSWTSDLDRSTIFRLNNANCRRLWHRLNKEFMKNPALYCEFGLLPGVAHYNSDGTIKKLRKPPDTTFEVHSVRRARRIMPDGTFSTVIVAVIAQRQAVALDTNEIVLDDKQLANGFFWFRGGATLIIDPRTECICYSIIKNIGNDDRRARQKGFLAQSAMSPLRRLYFSDDSNACGAVAEPFAMMHAARGEFDDG